MARWDHLCDDCLNRHDDENYMVHDHLWPLLPGALLCIGCLEIRLGRHLRADDFADVPCNWAPNNRRRSARFKKRLADGEPPQRWRNGTAHDPLEDLAWR